MLFRSVFLRFVGLQGEVPAPAMTTESTPMTDYIHCSRECISLFTFHHNNNNTISLSLLFNMSEMSAFTLPPGDGRKVCVGGGAGFIGSHIAKRLKENGYKVTVVDWKTNEFMENDEFCDEFILGDLRKLEVACNACEGCVQVYNLAADMGGMGFIVSRSEERRVGKEC